MVDPKADTPAAKLELELRRGVLVLAVLGQLRSPQYGYSLRQALAGRGMPIEEGTLYPLLRRLELPFRSQQALQFHGHVVPVTRRQPADDVFDVGIDHLSRGHVASPSSRPAITPTSWFQEADSPSSSVSPAAFSR